MGKVQRKQKLLDERLQTFYVRGVTESSQHIVDLRNQGHAIVGRVVGMHKSSIAYVDIGEVDLLTFHRAAAAPVTEGALVAVVDVDQPDESELWVSTSQARRRVLASAKRMEPVHVPAEADCVYELSPWFRVGNELWSEVARSQRLEAAHPHYDVVDGMPVFSPTLTGGDLRGLSPLVERAIKAQRTRRLS